MARALDMHPWQPTIVLLQAGDLNTGAYCPFTELVRIARAWRLDPYIRRIWLVSGSEIQTPAPAERVELVASWICNSHRWFKPPCDCGYASIMSGCSHEDVSVP